MSYRIVKRTEIGLDPVVRSSNGSPRPAISKCRWLTVHYTGVNVKYGDVGDTPAEIRALENYAQSAGKPNEYNYVIGQDDDDLVYEYAGAFRAAHSEGENGMAVGVLMFNGIREAPTAKQIDKLRWLRDAVLVPMQVLQPSPITIQHNQMPGASTSCPGPLIIARWGEFLQPWFQPVPPPSGGDMAKMNVIRLRFDGYAEQLVGFHTSGETLANTQMMQSQVVVLPKPSAALKDQIEAELGHPLTPT